MKFLKKFLSLLVPLVVIIGIFLIPEVIKVSKVECRSQFGPCSTSIEGSLSKYEGGSLRKAKKEVSAYLSSQNQIGDFSLRLKLPSTLSVYLLEKKARFALKDKERQVFATVDEEGVVLALFSETNLPYVELKKANLNTGEKVLGGYLTALNLQERLFSAYQVRNGELAGEALIVELPEGYTVLFPLDRDPDELMGALSLILTGLKGSEGVSKIDLDTSINTIDLRFKNPVLK